MIILNGREVYPQRIKRIQLGDKIIYLRRSKMTADMEFSFDLEALLNGVPTVPLESEIGFLLDIAAGPETELRVVASSASEIELGMETDIDAELYVELTAPMFFDDPVTFVLDTEAFAPQTAACEMDETVNIILEAEANAPAAVNTGQKEEILVDIGLLAEGNAADSALLEEEKIIFELSAEGELRAAETAAAEAQPEIVFDIESDLETPEALSLESFLGVEIDIEAELWIKPGEWIDPVLKNSVLGITQAFKTEQSGNILKIY
ncbi:MAG: hypothetical protein IJ306_08865 [Oscillospiraceae bacterium]|nr:hypothetical protein [Oscillospiraceae bacterium]